MIRVRFRGFWSGFEPSRSLVGDWCRAALGDFATVASLTETVDIEFHSVRAFSSRSERLVAYLSGRHSSIAAQRYRRAVEYCEPYQRGPSRAYAWYTGENVRPPLDFDLTLSHDIDDYGGANLYAPFVLDRIDFGLGAVRRGIPVAELLTPRVVRHVPPRFCAAVMTNPHPLRRRLVNALSSIGAVDVYGRGFGKPIDSKAEILSQYRFAIALENDLFPGYVTEKAVEAWHAGAVPLWWGDDRAHLLNQDAMLNLASYQNLASFVSAVNEVEADRSRWLPIAQAPILARSFDHQPIIDAIARLAR